MSNDTKIRILIKEYALPNGKTAIQFVLTEFDEDGEYGTITLSESSAKMVSQWLRRNHRLKWRAIRGFIANPILFIYEFIREFRGDGK